MIADDGRDVVDTMATDPGDGMRPLEGRLVLLGVTGSIAAYKAAQLVRLLGAAGADVQVLMTHSATAFIGPLTLATLSRHPVMTDPLELMADGRIGHIVVADTADAIVVAPATAHWLAAMATGMAGDVVTAACLASTAPVVVAPAMDGEMYGHPATQANVERLRSFGYRIVEPGVGPLASGAVGRGRLADLHSIADAVIEAAGSRAAARTSATSRTAGAMAAATPSAPVRDREGWRIVVSAGGTAEAIDPVRFIGNRSSGKMGMAVAAAALARGAEVTLIRGTTSVPAPPGAAIVDAVTARAMRDAVLEALPGSDALVMAAAVADFRPRAPSDTKLARADGLTLELEPTDDILAAASARAHAEAGRTGRRPVLIGFAAEAGSLARAPEKAARKGVDLLVANDVSEPGSGFGTDTNRVTIVVPGRAPEPWPQLAKSEVADRLLDRIVATRAALGASSAS